MRIALIKGHSRYGVLRCVADTIADAIRNRGDEAVVLDVMEIALPELGERLRQAGPELVLSFNILSDYRDPDGRSIRDLTGAPHIVHFVDHPLHHLERLKATPKETALLFVDREHPKALDKLLGPGRFLFSGFCPHGALGKPAMLPDDPEAYIAQRPVTALFTGTLYKPTLVQVDQLPEQVRRIFRQAIDISLARDGLDAVAAIDTVLRNAGMNPDKAARDPKLGEGIRTMRQLAYLVDDFVRAQRRIRLFEALLESAMPLTVAGEGYEAYTGRPQADYRGQVPGEDIPALMRQARIVFSANANFGSGSHERPLTAMLAGAVAASDFSTFYESEFRPGSEIALFRWTRFEKDFAAIQMLSSDPPALLAMAKAGQAAVIPRHRWLSRIDNYYEAAKAVR